MISTRLQDGAILHLFHRITGLVTEEEVRAGLVDAHEVIKGAVYGFDSMPMIVDKRDCTFASLNAQRLWSTGLKDDEFFRKHIVRIAVIGTDSTTFQMEQAELKGMASADLQFFLTIEEARTWIRNKN